MIPRVEALRTSTLGWGNVTPLPFRAARAAPVTFGSELPLLAGWLRCAVVASIIPYYVLHCPRCCLLLPYCCLHRLRRHPPLGARRGQSPCPLCVLRRRN